MQRPERESLSKVKNKIPVWLESKVQEDIEEMSEQKKRPLYPLGRILNFNLSDVFFH